METQSAAPAAASTASTTEAPQVTEQAAPVEEAKPAEDPEFSRKFAALTRRERAILDREKQIKSQMNDPVYKEYETFRQLKADPRRNATKLVESLGIPLSDFYQDLTSLVLNDGKPSVEQEIKALKDQLEADRKRQETERLSAEEAQTAQLIDNYKRQIVSQVDSKADTFEFMKANADDGSYDLAFEVALQAFEQTGKIIPVEKACEEVEKWYEAKARKLQTIKKLSMGNAQQDTPSAEQKVEPVERSVHAQSKTLTNSGSVASVAAPPASQPYGNLMDPEVRKRWTAEKIRQQNQARK